MAKKLLDLIPPEILLKEIMAQEPFSVVIDRVANLERYYRNPYKGEEGGIHAQDQHFARRGRLISLVPIRTRSRVINEALRKELLHRRRQSAVQRILQLRDRSGTLGSAAILATGRADRRRQG